MGVNFNSNYFIVSTNFSLLLWGNLSQTAIVSQFTHEISESSPKVHTGKDLRLCALQQGHGGWTPGGPPAPDWTWPTVRKTDRDMENKWTRIAQEMNGACWTQDNNTSLYTNTEKRSVAAVLSLFTWSTSGTHPEVSRFTVTCSEPVYCVLECGAYNKKKQESRNKKASELSWGGFTLHSMPDWRERCDTTTAVLLPALCLKAQLRVTQNCQVTQDDFPQSVDSPLLLTYRVRSLPPHNIKSILRFTVCLGYLKASQANTRVTLSCVFLFL